MFSQKVSVPEWDLHWVRLAPGVYLHRWEPSLAVVRDELCSSYNIPDDLSDLEWAMVATTILATAQSSWPEVLDAGIRVQDIHVERSVRQSPSNNGRTA